MIGDMAEDARDGTEGGRQWPRTSTSLARGIPRPIAERLGRIVVHSTHIEYYMLLVTKRLLGVGIAHARDLFGDGTWEVRFARLCRLAEAKRFTLTVPAGFVTSLKEVETRRNLLVHASWRHNGNNLVVHKARGQHARNPIAVEVDVAYLSETAAKMDVCLKALLALKAQTDTLVASPP